MVVYSKITVDGTQYSDAKEIEVTSAIGDNNSASSFKAVFPNEDGLHKTDFAINEEVIIYAEQNVNPPTTVIFSLIEDIDFRGKDTGREEVIISGRDYSVRLMDSTVEPEVYNDSEVSTIVTDIISKYTQDITTMNVDVTTTTLSYIAFNHVNVFDALKQLAELSDFMFYVNIKKDLHFEKKSSISSGITLDNTNVYSSKFRETDKLIYNKVWIYGDRRLTGWKEIQNVAAGSAYTLEYKPHNTKIDVNGTRYRGGIFEMSATNPSGVQYLVNYDEKQIVFVSGTDAGDNIPSAGSILFDYEKLTPIAKYGENTTSISDYGPHTYIKVDKSIKDPRIATELVRKILTNFNSPKKEGTLELQGVTSLIAGNTVTVNLPNENVSSAIYDVLEVKYTLTKKTERNEKIMRVRVANKIRDVVDTIKDILIKLKQLQADSVEFDVLTRLMDSAGSTGVRVKNWIINTKSLGHSFIIGHPVNGQIGSPNLGVNGSHILIGDHKGALTFHSSGGDI